MACHVIFLYRFSLLLPLAFLFTVPPPTFLVSFSESLLSHKLSTLPTPWAMFLDCTLFTLCVSFNLLSDPSTKFRLMLFQAWELMKYACFRWRLENKHSDYSLSLDSKSSQIFSVYFFQSHFHLNMGRFHKFSWNTGKIIKNKKK